jgi:site-specific DNA recombinase
LTNRKKIPGGKAYGYDVLPAGAEGAVAVRIFELFAAGEAVRRKIAPIIRAIEDDMYQPSMKERMAELEAEKALPEKRLGAAPEPPKIRLHPDLPGLHREKVAALEQALADPAINAEAAEVIRRQIERITLTPSENGTLAVQLYGDLARILQFCEAGAKTTTPRPW